MTLYRGPGGTGSATSDADTSLYQQFLDQTEAARDAALQAETNAELAETNAETAETNAAASAANAAASAASAAASAASAAASFDAFDDIYLGAKSSDPTLDNDGNALNIGDQYFNSVANELRVYNGSTWQTASTIGGTVTNLTVLNTIGGSISGNAATATTATNVSGGTASVTTLTTSSTVTHNGGTANGVAYLNGSKVLTTGSALTFDGTNFGVGGAALSLPAGYTVSQVSGTSGAGLFRATSTSVDVRFQADQVGGVGLINVASNHPLAFNVNATEQMRLTSTGLGIGTSSPSTAGGKLTVQGTGTYTVSAWNATAVAANVGATYYMHGGVDANNLGFIGAYFTGSTTTGGGYLTLGTRDVGGSTSEKARLDSSGNLGLGVTPSAWSLGKAIEVGNPGNSIFGVAASQLTITQNAYYNAAYKYGSTAAASRYDQAAGQHIWYTAASGTAGNAISFTQAMTLDASSQLAINTTTIQNSSAGRGNITLGGSSSTIFNLSVNSANSGSIYHTGTEMWFHNRANGPAMFFTNDTERARITSGGDLLVGTTGSSGRFTVSETGNPASQVSYIECTNASFNSRVLSLNASRNVTSSEYQFLVCSISGVESKFIIQNSGNAQNRNNSYGQITSDERFKQDIVDAGSQWADIKAIKLKKYRWKSEPNGELLLGPIAQQLQQVSPGLIDKRIATAEDVVASSGAVQEGDEVLGWKSSILYLKAVGALQEAMARIEQLETKVEAQAAEIAALKGQA